MKQIAGILLSMLLALSVLTNVSAIDINLSSGDFEFKISQDGIATIKRYTGRAAEPEIPTSIDGHPVRHIGENAFRDSGFIEKVSIPYGVESIGAMAFYNCTALSSVKFPAISLMEIGDFAFAYCGALTQIVLIEGVQRIGEYAFGDCTALAFANVPESVVEIGSEAFSGAAEGFFLYGFKESYVEEYAQANGIPFNVFGKETAGTEAEPPVAEVSVPIASNLPVTAFPSGTSEQPEEDVPEDLPPIVADDEVLKPTPGPAVTAEIAVRFPHADRTGTYTGEMRDGLPHGNGSFTCIPPSGILWTYDGAWENGAMNGFGTLVWSDGLQYRGSMMDNQPTQGEWLVNGAVVYGGGFRMLQDSGLFSFHGEGKLSNRLGRVIYEGVFASGYLEEAADARMARAQALDPLCEGLPDAGYAALLGQPDMGAGKLVKLTGTVVWIMLEQDQGEVQFVLLNNGSDSCPVLVRYRYGTGEVRVQAGRQVTLWGTIAGIYSMTGDDGRTDTFPDMDADVVALASVQRPRVASPVTLAVRKELEGRALRRDEFSFTLEQVQWVLQMQTDPVTGEEREILVSVREHLQTKTNDRAGKIAFDPMQYAAEDMGRIFTYAITEIPGDEISMAYDTKVITITVFVANGGGVPVAQVFYPPDATFINTYQANAELILEASKQLQGRNLNDGEFFFELKLGDELLQTKTNDTNGVITFDPIQYTQEDIEKAYVYKIIEVRADEAGMTYNTTAKTVKVSITDLGGGTLSVKTVYPRDMAFKNRYRAAGEAELAFTIDLENRMLKDKEFNFELKDAGKSLQKKANDQNGSILFAPIRYTQADIGSTNFYEIRQIPGKDKDIAYDTETKAIIVFIRDEGGGKLGMDMAYPDGTVFLNQFLQPVSLPVLSSVDVDITSLQEGDVVTFTPRVFGGLEPYRYHYRIERDDGAANDIGWQDQAVRRSRLSVAGVYQIQVTVEDANGNRTEPVFSPEVTVKKPASQPVELNGRWNVTLVITDFKALDEKTKNTTSLPITIPQIWTLTMQDEKTGTVVSDWKDLSPGTFSFTGGTILVKMADARGRASTTWEGEMGNIDGTFSFSGNFVMNAPNEIQYSGTWIARKEDIPGAGHSGNIALRSFSPAPWFR